MCERKMEAFLSHSTSSWAVGKAVGLERKHALENVDVKQGRENNKRRAALSSQPPLQVTEA